MALSQEETARAREILYRLNLIDKEKDQLLKELDSLQAKCPHKKSVPDTCGLLFFICADCGYSPDD